MNKTHATILFLSANPTNTQQLSLSKEVNSIDEELQKARERDEFDLEQRHAVSLSDLQGLLLRFEPDIVHFSGHGSQEGSLVFENNGKAEEAPPAALADLFRIVNSDKKNIQCVVLNACYTERQAEAIAKHVPCVIGMSNAISDEAAIKFAVSFYRGLGFGRSVNDAFELGCNEISLHNIPENAIPKLKCAPGGDPAKLYLAILADVHEIIEQIRSSGLEFLTEDYFREHRTTEKDLEYWKKGFPFKLEAIREQYELRRKVTDLVDGKMNEQMAILLAGESGASKSTILMELICDYIDKGYLVLYNLSSGDIKNSDQLVRNLKDLVRLGKKVLVAIDDAHTERSAAIFYVIDQFSSFELRGSIRFVLTARLPDYDWLTRHGLDKIPESSYRNAIKKFRDDPAFRYQLPQFSIGEIGQFVEKYAPSLASQEALFDFSSSIYNVTNGNPILVKFAVLGQGLRKDAEDRLEEFLDEPNYLVTMLVLSILSIGGEKATDDLLEKMNLKKYALRLEYATLYRSTVGVWKTIHSRWDIELFKLLYVEERDEITLDTNIERLKDAVVHIFSSNDERLTVSVIQMLYNTVSVNNIIPLGIVHKVVGKNLPSYLSQESRALIYGVIMPTSFLMQGQETIAEELCNQALLLKSNNPEICYNLALNFVAFGKYDKAMELCDKAVYLDNTKADIWYTKACLYINHGDVERGLHDLEEAIKIDRRYSALALEESFFEGVRSDKRFLALVSNF